jgi:hypothetical protein
VISALAFAAGFKRGFTGLLLLSLILGNFSLSAILEDFTALFYAFFPGAFKFLDCEFTEKNLLHHTTLTNTHVEEVFPCFCVLR